MGDDAIGQPSAANDGAGRDGPESAPTARHDETAAGDDAMARRVLVAAMSGSALQTLDRAVRQRRRRHVQIAACAISALGVGGLWFGATRGQDTSISPADQPDGSLAPCYDMVLREPGTETHEPSRCVGLVEFVEVAINGQCEPPADAVLLIEEAIESIAADGWTVVIDGPAAADGCARATLAPATRTVTVTVTVAVAVR